MKKLLLISSNSIHISNYLELVEDYFDSVLVITNEKRNGYPTDKIVDFELNLTNYFKTPKRIQKIINEFQPSVIHIHQANSVAFYSLIATKRIKIPTILTVWGSDVLVNPKNSFLLKKLVQFCLNRANYITTDSLYVADEVYQLTPHNEVGLIANFGVSFLPVSCEKENIIFSNRLHDKLYQIDKIIDAFYLFQKKYPSWKLIIAGNGEETENLKQQVVNLQLSDHVTFVGWTDKRENAEWYGKSKLWISIPYSDGVGISMLEAMAYGCIPIVLDLPVKHEWIENGKNGVIINDVDSEFISQGLLLDQEQVRKINEKIVHERATKEVNKKKFIQFYKKIFHSMNREMH